MLVLLSEFLKSTLADFLQHLLFYFIHYRYPVSYNAYFSAGSDPEFTVSPASGELLPLGSNGTLVRVGFCPSVYGKIYTGKLIIQVCYMFSLFKILLYFIC